MNLTKLREFAKINSNIVQNCCKKFSYKYEISPSTTYKDQSIDDANTAQSSVEEPQEPAVRYNVCQSRSSPVTRPGSPDANRDTAKANIDHQHLQPCMLPEFYANQLERSVLITPKANMNERDKMPASNQRKFQVSKTCANCILPLKMVKLANPFPEPVKMMSSRTVSDQEKSDQMLMEAKSQRHFIDSQQRRNFSTLVQRWYSRTVGKNPSKCKKFPGSRKSCPKLKVDNCPPPARTRCDRIPKDINCKKQEAPYPAYSEFCHEDLDEKPSECKLCPWKPEENPNFKAKKKHYHTACFLLQRRGLELQQQATNKQQNKTSRAADVDLEEEDNAEEPHKTKSSPTASAKSMLLGDLRKPPCKRPDKKRCPPSKKSLLKEKKDKGKKKNKKKAGARRQLTGASLSAPDLLESEFLRDDNDDLLRMKDGKDEDWCHKVDKCKIKKFPFPKCPEPKQKGQGGLSCPKKKRKPLVKDCPPNNKCTFDGGEEVEEMQLSSNKRGKNCPKIDMTKIPMKRPCKPRPKENTKKCPADLLKKPTKSRKPKKKCADDVDEKKSNEDVNSPLPPSSSVSKNPSQPVARV